MSFRIVNKQIINKDCKRLDIHVGQIASQMSPGQYVVIVPEEFGEWVSIPVIDWDPQKQTIAVIASEEFQKHKVLASVAINEALFSVMGPLGCPFHAEKQGTVICVGTENAVAQILPIARALKRAGNKVLGVLAAETKERIILETQMRLACYRIFMSIQNDVRLKKTPPEALVADLTVKEDVQSIYVAGDIDLVEKVASQAKDCQVPIYVQLPPLPVCGQGVCGACRIKVNSKFVLACEEGLMFPAQAVDFNILRSRLNALFNEDQRDRGLVGLSQTGYLKKVLDGFIPLNK